MSTLFLTITSFVIIGRQLRRPHPAAKASKGQAKYGERTIAKHDDANVNLTA